jgi:hypothetical protein
MSICVDLLVEFTWNFFQENFKNDNLNFFVDWASFISFDFTFFDPSIFLFKSFISLLNLIVKSKKSILFLGLPIGLEESFYNLVKENKHYVLTAKRAEYLLKKNYAFDYDFFYKKKLKMIFILDFELYSKYHLYFSKLNIPTGGFVTPQRFLSMDIDYPLFFNTTVSLKGSLFCYNFFNYFFKNHKKVKLSKKFHGLH